MATAAINETGRVLTARGGWVDLYFPKPDQIEIEDIAGALSRLCRFQGRCKRFYSVAEHSVAVSHLVPAALALPGLLHDAAECFVSDLPRPLKRMPELRGYLDIEGEVADAVAERFGMSGLLFEVPSIKAADNLAVDLEGLRLVEGWVPSHGADEILSARISLQRRAGIYRLGWSPRKAEREFLRRFYELTGKGGLGCFTRCVRSLRSFL